MSYAVVQSCSLAGVDALPVTVEVHKSGGLPGLSIVGLPESAVRESKDRVRAAIENIGLTFHQVKIIVNLAPADLPKRGGRFDLPIALGFLLATGQLPEHCLQGLVVLGELGLDGELRPISGILPVSSAYAASAHSLFIPLGNAREALRCSKTRVHAAGNLLDAVEALRKRAKTPLHALSMKDMEFLQPESKSTSDCAGSSTPLDMADVFGQQQARRALEITAAGNHNMLMSGPPGTGKSMLASRLPGIQPPMSDAECMESASVASISSGGFDASRWGVRPFRAPHHTASGVALVGGGSMPLPGEISLAHNGVLFLDELPEFSRSVLDVLREPMETGQITVSRAARQAVFPSRFQLIGAMNPCPCGYYNDAQIECRCGIEQIIRYQSRVSGPFLDRIDLHLCLQREQHKDAVLGTQSGNENSHTVQTRVISARKLQMRRQQSSNAMLDNAGLRLHANLDAASRELLEKAGSRLHLSLRAQHRLLKVARTIADLDASSTIEQRHLAESLTFRRTPLVDALVSKS